MKKSLSYCKSSVCALIIGASLFSVNVNAQTPALEFAAGAGNTTANGPVLTNQVITFQNNTNNPSGNTFAAYAPSLTATFSLSNQQYSLPTSQISTGKGLSFGANLNTSSVTASASQLFDQMGSISSPANSHFTSSTSVPSGTGIDISANKAVEIFTSARALYNANSSTSGRYYFGDLTITFNQSVTNPILHLVGLGGFYSNLGFTTELELQTPGIILSKLSGSNELTISSGTKILNSSSDPNSPTGAGAASGSVLASGSGITSLTFKLYLRGDGDEIIWGASNYHTGDVWLIGVSLNAPVNLTGNVFNDANGLTDSKVNGTGTGVPGGTQVYANLLNAGGNVLTSVAVSGAGVFTFGNVASLTSYTIQISINPGTKGQAAPATALPSGWINTGEYLGSGAGNDGAINGRLAASVASSNVTNANFGIERLPNSDTKWYAIGTPIPNSSILLNGIGLIPGALSGLDAEDGILGLLKSVAITSLPTGGNQLWYNGVQIKKGADGINPPSVSNPYVIPSYVLALLSIKFTGVGSTQTVFNYAFYDAAGIMDASPASYTISWTTVLPVKLVSFTAAALNNNTVVLNWITATENNLNRFIIEMSLDGINFTDAGIVSATGNTTEKTNYTFSDNNVNPASGITWYRLRSVDNDGRSELSETRMIRVGKQGGQSISVLVYPNPVSNELRITIPNNWHGKKISYQVVGNNGQIAINNEVASSNQTEAINVTRLIPGFYIVKVICGNETSSQKIIKQ